MKKSITMIILLVLTVFFLSADDMVASEHRAALVIGNGSYGDLGTLRNPPNDAYDMAQALGQLGFEVDLLIDADVVQMEQALIRFGQKLRQNRSTTGFFFFAGHGVQHQGENYLIPSQASIGSEVFLRTRSVSAQAVLDTMHSAGNELNIVVLDACRDNPFSWARSGQRGLTQVSSQPPGSIIAYATGAGEVAGDGEGRNGVYTSQLLRMLTLPGLDVSEIFRMTGQAVRNATNGRQVPAIYSQFFDKAVLLPGDTPPVQITQQVRQEPVSRQTAELFILTDPLGVPVTVDGNPKGATPVFISEIPVGSKVTIAGRDGNRSGQIEYHINTTGLHEVNLELKMETGHLLILTNERDAELLLGGVSQGSVGAGLFRDLPAGEYQVELHKQGMRISESVTVQSDRTANVNLIFGDAEAVAADARNLTIGYSGTDSAERVTQNLRLPTRGANGTTIRWTSSNSSVISSTGAVDRQSIDRDTVVTLTAVITRGRVSDSKRISVVVRAISRIGSTGPAGGLIFYDKGFYSDGWRYLEAAPYGWHNGGADPRFTWGGRGTSIEETSQDIGEGKANTERIVSRLGSGTYAAKVCDEYEVTVRGVTYDDWFLPSADELNLMYQNLHRQRLGGFTSFWYWSSSELNATNVWNQYFDIGFRSNFYKTDAGIVRPVRAF